MKTFVGCNSIPVGRMQSRFQSLVSWNTLWILLYAIGFGVFIIGMPKYIDDYRYMALLKPWFDAQGVINPDNGGNIVEAGIPWSYIWNVWEKNYFEDNIRLGNLIGTVLLLLPKWFGSGIALLCWMYAMLKCMRLVGIDLRTSALVPVGLFLWGFSMPWQEHFGSLIYQFNYLVSTALCVYLILLMLNGKRGWRHNLALAFVGLVLGWWHEGLAVPLGVSFCVLFITKFEFRNSGTVLCIICLFTATVVALYTPGMLERFNGIVNGNANIDLVVLLSGIRKRYPFIILIILLLLCLSRESWRKRLMTSGFIVLIVGVFVSAIIGLSVRLYSRAGWWCDFASVGCILYILRIMTGNYFVSYRWYNIIVWGPMLVLLYAHLFYVGKYVAVIRQDRDNLVRFFSTKPEGPYFGTPQIMSDTSPLCFMVPGFDYTAGAMISEGLYFEGKSDNVLGRYYVVPRELEYVNAGSGRELPGGAGVREYKGRYFMPADSLWMGAAIVPVDFGKGYVPVHIHFNDFISKGDGHRYVWLNMQLNWFMTHFRHPRAVSLGFAECGRWGWKDFSDKKVPDRYLKKADTPKTD